MMTIADATGIATELMRQRANALIFDADRVDALILNADRDTDLDGLFNFAAQCREEVLRMADAAEALGCREAWLDDARKYARSIAER